MDVRNQFMRDGKEEFATLDLSYSDPAEVPQKILQYPNVTSLILVGIGLAEIPECVWELKNLTHLDLEDNRLDTVPEKILGFKNLTHLCLGGNNLNDIPKPILSLTGLKKLDLSHNHLSKIPKGIHQLTNLTHLDLTFNRFNSIPQEILQLKCLTHLYIRNVGLSNIPKEIIQLENLTYLNLEGNHLGQLPNEILQLRNLTHLELKNNPLIIPPIEIACKDVDEIRNYFESLKRSGFKKLYEAKLIIVGKGGVGKTCLAKTLSDDSFSIEKNEPTTEGIAIHDWTWDWRKGNELAEFKVNIWDFGGQEIYHATHQFFLTKRSLYLFVWDARFEDDISNFNYWLNIINLLSDKSPVLIVLNKCDERIKEIDQASLKNKFPNIIGFHKVSCLTGDGIKGLEKQIKESIVELPHVGTNWPNIWTRIRGDLEKDKRDYITYTEYKAICEKEGLNEEEANYLSSYLHDLGVMLHFQDDKILKNIVILKPDWGTNAVYKVLDTKQIQKDKGRFDFKDLKKIWGRTQYPSEKHAELLQLMSRFELCFNLTDSDKYIVPELLSPEGFEIERIDKDNFANSSKLFSLKGKKIEWPEKENLRFEYHYDFMPSGVITRFIVRNHRLVEGKNYWRNGVVLVYEEKTWALVICDEFKRKIKISIIGENKGGLLEIIRNEFNIIHKTLNNPQVKEMIPCNCSMCASEEEASVKYEYPNLKRKDLKGIQMIQCDKSDESVSIRALLSGVEALKSREIANPYLNTVYLNPNREVEPAVRVAYTAKPEVEASKKSFVNLHPWLYGVAVSLIAGVIFWLIFREETVRIVAAVYNLFK